MISNFSQLPCEIQFTIFALTTPRDVCRLRQTCKGFRDVLNDKVINDWIVLQKEHDHLVNQSKPRNKSQVKVSRKWKDFLIAGKVLEEQPKPDWVAELRTQQFIRMVEMIEYKKKVSYDVHDIVPPTYNSPAHFSNNEQIKAIYGNKTQLYTAMIAYLDNNKLRLGMNTFIMDERLVELSKTYEVGDIVIINPKYNVLEHFDVCSA